MGIPNPLGTTFDIVEGFPPVDLSSGANAGDWVDLSHAAGVLVLFHSGLGTAGDDPTLKLQQATDNSGTSAKDIDFTEVFRKQAATSLASTTVWTRTTQTAATSYTNATSAEQSALWAVWVDADALDVANSFTHIQASVADVGTNAQPGACYYIVIPAVANKPENAISYVA